MAKKIKTEFVVIGAGPGGYTAAFRLADLGKNVLLIDRDPMLGGVCLNRGCIPSKALLHVSKIMNQAKELSKAELEKIRSELSKDFQSPIKIDYKYDPNLIGGLIIQVGSVMVDTSIKTKLRQLQKSMIEA